jgi:hypothetical protein
MEAYRIERFSSVDSIVLDRARTRGPGPRKS